MFPQSFLSHYSIRIPQKTFSKSESEVGIKGGALVIDSVFTRKMVKEPCQKESLLLWFLSLFPGPLSTSWGSQFSSTLFFWVTTLMYWAGLPFLICSLFLTFWRICKPSECKVLPRGIIINLWSIFHSGCAL